MESLAGMLVSHPPSAPPTLPFDENSHPHDLGVGKIVPYLNVVQLYMFSIFT